MTSEKKEFLYQPIYAEQGWSNRRTHLKNELNYRLCTLLSKVHPNKAWRQRIKGTLDRPKTHYYDPSKWKYDEPYEEKPHYSEVKTKSITLVEVIEIDEFDEFEKAIVKLVSSKSNLYNYNPSGDNIKKVKHRLQDIKVEFNKIKYESLFAFDLRESTHPDFSLIDFLSCSFVKTHESYVILQFLVKPSALFHESFEKLLEGKSGMMSIPIYNNIVTALRTNRAYNQSTSRDIIENNISYLFMDINVQVKRFVKRHFNGLFLKSAKLNYLPSVEVFTVNSIPECLAGKGLKNYLRRASYDDYMNEDQTLAVVSQNLMFDFVKLRGFKILITDKFMASEEESVVNYHIEKLIRAVSVTWALRNITDVIGTRSIDLKRRVFDFIKINSKKSLINWLLRIPRTYEMISLKSSLVQMKVVVGRLENEFAPKNLKIYTQDAHLEELVNAEREGNFKIRVTSQIRYRIEHLEREIDQLKQYFKLVEEINKFRTNLSLQIVSLLVGIMSLAVGIAATILAIDKGLFTILWGWLIK